MPLIFWRDYQLLFFTLSCQKEEASLLVSCYRCFSSNVYNLLFKKIFTYRLKLLFTIKKGKSWPLAVGLGAGAGMGYANCQNRLNHPFLVKAERVKVITFKTWNKLHKEWPCILLSRLNQIQKKFQLKLNSVTQWHQALKNRKLHLLLVVMANCVCSVEMKLLCK